MRGFDAAVRHGSGKRNRAHGYCIRHGVSSGSLYFSLREENGAAGAESRHFRDSKLWFHVMKKMVSRSERLWIRRPEWLRDTSGGVSKEPIVAVIDEALCIGCTLCIQACPVDAILGAAKQMHTVLRRDCTGCELCIPPCPVDCIDMLPATIGVH